MLRTILFVSLLLAGTTVFAQAPAVGESVPEIALPDTKGKTVKLSSLKGKVVLIDFWASWCGPCRRSNGDLAKLYKKYRDKGFEIFAISLDESKDEWKTAISEDETTWLHVIETAKQQISTKWNVEYIPTSYLLDKDGKVVAVNPSKEKIEAYLKRNISNP